MGMMGGGGPPMMHWWAGGRKKPDTGQANSGLTGAPALEQPPVPEGPKDLRGRWENLKQSVVGTTAALPRVLRLLWGASPRTTLRLFAATLFPGIIPAGAAYTSKLLINAVVRGILIHNTHVPDVVTFHDLDPNLHGGPNFTAVNMIIVIAIVQLVLFAV